jgi:pimeloyl-ACP methyl ester carboxylesterase
LQARFTIYACDRRGQGESTDAPGYDLTREFEDVAAIVDGIGGPVDLIGHSYGALCSLEAALRAKNLRRLVVYEPPIPTGEPIYPPGMEERLQALLDKGDREGLITTWMVEIVRVPPHELDILKARPAWRRRVAAAHTVVREMRASSRYAFDAARFHDLKVPVLILLGGDSPGFFKAAVDRVQAALPDARTVVMPGQQHTAMDTNPALFTKEVLAFLGRP